MTRCRDGMHHSGYSTTATGRWAGIPLIASLILLAAWIAGCEGNPQAASPIPPEIAGSPTVVPNQPAPGFDLSAYAFPDSIDSTKRYLFYLHGKIIEDLGMPAVSPDFGEYEYENQIMLTWNVLSIYDASDMLAGSCQELLAYSEGKGLSKSKELVLQVG